MGVIGTNEKGKWLLQRRANRRVVAIKIEEM
jgi:hypothetical protein